MPTTIEQKTANAILQTPLPIKVGDKTYMVAPPSVATLIMASERISQMPPLVDVDKNNVLQESLNFAKDCEPLGDILAIFILGAKYIKEKGNRKGGLFHLKPPKDPIKQLSHELLCNLTPTELHDLSVTLLQRMEIGDFFALTTFLCEVNQLRGTRKVEKES